MNTKTLRGRLYSSTFLVAALALASISLPTCESVAQERKFVLLTKMLNFPYFELAHQGCREVGKESSEFDCDFFGPTDPNEEEQVRIAEDIFSREIDGIAICPANAPAMAKMVKRANSRAIPVVTWDNDFIERDRSLRATYIGSDNYDIGFQLGKALLKIRPQGGKYAMLTGFASSFSLNERLRGVRDALKESSYEELAGTPLYCNDDGSLAVKQIEELLARAPDLNALVPIGAWPQTVQSAYRRALKPYRERLDNKELVIASADTLPMQLELLRDGFTHALVGQRPTEMARVSMEVLNKLSRGESVPDRIITGLDICFKESLDSCLSGEH